MKVFLKVFLLIFFFFGTKLETLSISNYEILKICRSQRMQKRCIKRLKINRELINKGKPIEIQVIPYKAK